MRWMRFVLLSFLFAISIAGAARAGELGLAFTAPEWTGGSVPGTGICTMHGGKGMSPAIKVTDIPAGTDRLVMKFTDRDWGGEGAHGVVGIKVPQTATSITIPSFKGEVDALPAEIEKISIHQCRACAEGVYLGPCSGGGGHQYYVTISAESADGKSLADGKLVLGNF
jgi:phosphatidylethanolamine-binding protein (PEBP) family uncharacterized protein